MLERGINILAFVILCIFLGIFAYKVPRVDLGVAIAITLVMAFYDLFIYRRKND